MTCRSTFAAVCKTPILNWRPISAPSSPSASSGARRHDAAQFTGRRRGRDAAGAVRRIGMVMADSAIRSEEHTSELQSQSNLVCRLLLEKKKKTKKDTPRAHQQRQLSARTC